MKNKVEMIEPRSYAFGSEDLYKEDVEKMKRLGFEVGEQVAIKDVPIRPTNADNTCERGVQHRPGFLVKFTKIS